MHKSKGEIWKFIPSGDWFYVERRRSRYFMSLKVIKPSDAARIMQGIESPPKLEREVKSLRAFEAVPEMDYMNKFSG